MGGESIPEDIFIRFFLFDSFDDVAGQLFIKAGGMEDTSWLSVDTTCWTSTARDWCPSDLRTAAFERNPGL